MRNVRAFISRGVLPPILQTHTHAVPPCSRRSFATDRLPPQYRDCLDEDGVTHLCGPVGRGGSILAAGLSSGRLVLLDCRAPRKLKVGGLGQRG